MRARKVTITETERGWFNSFTGKTHETAVEAFNAVRSDSNKRVSESGEGEAVVVTWHATSRVGNCVVRAITNA